MCTKRRNYSTSDLCAFSITVICVFLLLFYIKEELGVRQFLTMQQTTTRQCNDQLKKKGFYDSKYEKYLPLGVKMELRLHIHI